MSNQKTAIQFIQTCALESPKKAFELYVHPHFRHHNQYFAGDGKTLMEAMIEADKTHPNKAFSIKQVFETDDRVALFSHVVKDEMEIAVIHIMRFENGKIAEMWDVGQVIDPQSPNQFGMF